MRAIAYSLFGYGQQTPDSCFEFETYCRGLFVNIRINRIIYPDWTNVVKIDHESRNSKYKAVFDWLEGNTNTKFVLMPSGQHLCRNMLARFQTVFSYAHPTWEYSHVLCRDSDSISTYREAQAVAQWIKEDRSSHCITDSISHNIPMMGGMCGFRPGYVNDRLQASDNPDFIFSKLLERCLDIDFSRKGSDQDFLMRVIYPKVQDSITAHFVLGIRQVVPEGEGIHYKIDDIDIGIDPAHKFLDTCAGHIGASGYYEPPMIRWLNTIDPFRQRYLEIQQKFPKLFFWTP